MVNFKELISVTLVLFSVIDILGSDMLRKVFGIILMAIAIKLFRDNFHLIIETPMKGGGSSG